MVNGRFMLYEKNDWRTRIYFMYIYMYIVRMCIWFVYVMYFVLRELECKHSGLVQRTFCGFISALKCEMYVCKVHCVFGVLLYASIQREI